MTDIVMTTYRTIVAGTDGSALADLTVARAATAAVREGDALILVCAYAELSRRAEAKNTTTLGGDTRLGQVLGRSAAEAALQRGVQVARDLGATDVSALLVEGEPAAALLQVAADRGAQLIVLGAIRDRSLADRLIGTVAEEVLKRAMCDVLVVRPVPGDVTELPVPESA